jgi:hypothetical protein
MTIDAHCAKVGSVIPSSSFERHIANLARAQQQIAVPLKQELLLVFFHTGETYCKILSNSLKQATTFLS